MRIEHNAISVAAVLTTVVCLTGVFYIVGDLRRDVSQQVEEKNGKISPIVSSNELLNHSFEQLLVDHHEASNYYINEKNVMLGEEIIPFLEREKLDRSEKDILDSFSRGMF